MDKLILDMCCGGKMFYFDKKDPRVLFNDIRRIKTKLCDGRDFEVSPDTQYDFVALPGEWTNKFETVIFDPPHLLRNTGKSKFADLYGSLNEKAMSTGQQIKYGALYTDWRDMLKKGFAEGFRVLRSNGILIFKWNETDIKVSEVLALTQQKPLLGQRCGKTAKTHWIIFVKT